MQGYLRVLQPQQPACVYRRNCNTSSAVLRSIQRNNGHSCMNRTHGNARMPCNRNPARLCWPRHCSPSPDNIHLLCEVGFHRSMLNKRHHQSLIKQKTSRHRKKKRRNLVQAITTIKEEPTSSGAETRHLPDVCQPHVRRPCEKHH